MTLEQEIIAVLNQIVPTIEKAFMDAMVLRHPGHPNQKTHGNRFGAGQAKESFRRLKDDKAARERYKTEARKRGATEAAKDLSQLNKFQLQGAFYEAKTAKQRARVADEMYGRSGFADKTVAKTKEEIPAMGYADLRPSTIGPRGKLSVFLDDNNTYNTGPIVKDEYGDYYTGTLGRVRKVKPEFVGGK